MRRNYELNPIISGVHNNTLYQPQMTNHFELNIYLTKDLQGAVLNQNEIAANRKYLSLAATEFSLPTITTAPLDIPFGNTLIHIAGKTEFGGSDSVTFIDYIGADIERIIYNQQMMVTNPETGQQGWAANYKTGASVIQYAPDGSCLSSWIYEGFWISAVNYGSLSKSSADIKTIEATISYDIAYKRYDAATGRTGHVKAAELAAQNMAWKAQKTYNADSPNADGTITAGQGSGPLGGDWETTVQG